MKDAEIATEITTDVTAGVTTEVSAGPCAEPRCVLVSDVHLGPRARPEIARALCELVGAHSDRELIFVGDTFEFSAIVDPDPERAWQVIKRANPEVLEALRAHSDRGAGLTFVAGNHDAVLPRLSEHFARDLGPEVSVVPWFTRRGKVHVEHGHLWDRDNAPLHPLAHWSPRSEPLGISLMRRFCAACDATEFAHAHQTTPAGGLLRAFRLFGFKAPLLIVRYLTTALALCLEALLLRPRQVRRANLEGGERAALLAAELELQPRALESLLAQAPTPTHRRFVTTFMRLYFDRVLTAIACLGALISLAAVGPTGVGIGVLTLGAGYLYWGGRTGNARYPGPVEALRRASEGVASKLGADVVVFGHTHVEQADPSYVNLGSFAYSPGPGRPYALLEGARVSAHHWPKSAVLDEPSFT